jgi:branched-chain amino acid aminotransferase/4-amino-4-deoxychorismate lyase
MTPPPPSPFLPWLGLFETLRVVAGRPLFLDEHWNTLRASAEELDLALPVDFRERANELPRVDGRWRWILTAETAFDRFDPEPDTTPEAFSLATSELRLGSRNWDARHKTLSYLTHWQARHAARAAGFDEALLLNEWDEVASGAMSNVFWVRDGQVFTPSPDAGCRHGVVRDWVLRTLRTVPEQVRVPLSELEKADEIFLSNSWIGVRPVTTLDGRSLAAGPVALGLRDLYLQATGLSLT